MSSMPTPRSSMDILRELRDVNIPNSESRHSLSNELSSSGVWVEHQALVQKPDEPAINPRKEAIMKKLAAAFQVVKVLVLLGLMIAGIVFFATGEEMQTANSYAVSVAAPIIIPLSIDPSIIEASITLHIPATNTQIFPTSEEIVTITMALEMQHTDEDNSWRQITNTSELYISGNISSLLSHEDGSAREYDSATFFLPSEAYGRPIRFNVVSNSILPLAVEIDILPHSSAFQYQILFAGLLLVLVYTLIIFDLVHRTIAGLIGSFIALACLSMLGKRPSLDEIVVWLKMDTLCLLFGLMVIVGIFSTTGFFEYAALKAYKASKGKTWRLLLILGVLIAVSSAFIDDVTAILLLAPATLRLCNVINIKPIPILISEVLLANIGGAATGIGDAAGAIIISTPAIQAAGVSYLKFTLYLVPGTLVIAITAFVIIRLFYRRELREAPSISSESIHLQKEIEIWKKTANDMHDDIHEEREVHERLNTLIAELEDRLALMVAEESNPEVDLAQLEKECEIKDMGLLVNCTVVLSVVVMLFFLEPYIQSTIRLPPSWASVIGALILLVTSNTKNLEGILQKVEWTTLLFFASLFVLMQALTKMGLIAMVASAISAAINSVAPEFQLVFAISIILWASALLSGFVDNIPYIAAMAPIITALSRDLGLPLQPLAISLFYGTCLGANGTLIGSSGSVLVAGFAEAQGHPISFVRFFKLGYPLMLVTVTMANLYLILIFIAFGL